MPRPDATDALDDLRQAIRADQRSTAEIARAIDPPMSRDQLAQILSGHRNPTVSTINRIGAALRPARRVVLTTL